MSYLSALASLGFSVGMWIYNEKINGKDEPEATSEAPAADLKAAEVAKVAPVVPSKPLTPEEIAANRAEANARLEQDGALGQLQATEAASQVASPTGAEPLLLDNAKGDVDSSEDDDDLEDDDLTDESPKNKNEEDSAKPSGTPPPELNNEQKKQVEELKKRDQEVRTHEQAHVAAAAGMAGAPVYEYETGPDGVSYAVGGHVDIKTSGTSDPVEGLREAEILKRAATAPAEPSPQDEAVAAKASADIERFKAEIARGLDSAHKMALAKAPDSAPAADSGSVSAPATNLAQASAPEQGVNRLSSETSADNVEQVAGASVQPVVNKLSEPAPKSSAASYNGASLSQQVAGSYAAVKNLGMPPASQSARPFMAQV